MGAIRIPDFDVWQEGYAGASVRVYKAGGTVLASVFYDEALTTPAPNPLTLGTLSAGGVSFGKFTQPVYVGEDYYLDINLQEQTGVVRIPIRTLVGEDASQAVATALGATQSRAIRDHLAQNVWVEDYGSITGSASANSTTIQAAIGAAASAGGGIVNIPEGTIAITTLTIPAGVVLRGQGRGVTVLQSTEQQAVVQLTGNNAGMADLTLDGASLQASSIGLQIINKDYSLLRNVDIKRFETGIHVKGAKFSDWEQLFVTNCATGAKLHGDTSSSGSDYRWNRWDGGSVETCTTYGIDVSYESAEASHNDFFGIDFSGNSGLAVRLNGARFTEFDSCQFRSNTDNVHILDDDAASANNKVNGVLFKHCYFSGGTFVIEESVNNAVIKHSEINDVDFTLTTPLNALKFEDTVEDSQVTISGDGTKIVRSFDNLNGATRGVTTGNTPVKAWSLKLDPGEIAVGAAFVSGKARNGTDKASYIVHFSGQKAPSTLAYDAQTANFTVGQILTGGTSGATARIIADSDSGTTGTLTLHSIVGAFIDNETITDGAGGSALANGALVAGSVSVLGQTATLTTETDAAWACVAAASVDELEIQVTGNTSDTVDWVVFVYGNRFG